MPPVDDLPAHAPDPAHRPRWVRLLPRRGELRATLDLALPVAVVQVGLMAMGVVDTVMVGHVSAEALAAVALGNLYVFGVLIFGMGVLMALDPIVGQAVGARDEPAVARGVQRGLLIAVAMTLPSILVLLAASPVMTALRQPDTVVPNASGYARISAYGVFAFYAFVVLRQSLQAMGRVAPIVVVIVVANVANALLNWVLIFGHLGSPPLGVIGSAWATSLSRALMALALLAVSWRALRPYLRPVRPEAFHLAPLWRMLVLGVPIGAQYLLEFGAFAVVALLMGWLGTVQMAAHQIAINLASLTFMVPLGVSSAAAVLVGHAVGRGDTPGARRAARAALVIGVGFMATTAVLFRTLPGPLARLYTPDETVVRLAVLLIPIAGVFQVFDGLQAVGAGILRGIGDTRAPMAINVLGFWLIGMPLSIHLGFRTGAGPVGLWWGLVAGLGAVALLLLWRIREQLRWDLRRVQIDDEALRRAAVLDGD